MSREILCDAFFKAVYLKGSNAFEKSLNNSGAKLPPFKIKIKNRRKSRVIIFDCLVAVV